VTLQGAVETLLERSTHVQLQDGSVVLLDEKLRKAILASLHELSTKALRCLGFAYKEDLGEFATYDGEFHIVLDSSCLFLLFPFLICHCYCFLPPFVISVLHLPLLLIYFLCLFSCLALLMPWCEVYVATIY
jgi:hypothetical protein